jgi:hypothetical protein
MGASGTRRMGKPAPTKNFENRILASLPPEEYARLKGSFQILALRRKAVLNEPGRPLMDTVYFSRTAVASMVTTMEDGSTLEIATVGNEGVVGLPVLLGTETMRTEVFIQIGGEVVALPASVVRKLCGAGNLLGGSCSATRRRFSRRSPSPRRATSCTRSTGVAPAGFSCRTTACPATRFR